MPIVQLPPGNMSDCRSCQIQIKNLLYLPWKHLDHEVGFGDLFDVGCAVCTGAVYGRLCL